MPIHKLMVKTHRDTGLKYLCYTRRKNHDEYLGSGTVWRRHLKKHGTNITTELIFQSEDIEEFKRVAIAKSKEFNVVESREWANLKIEEGAGGDTASGKMWITNGQIDKYILKTEPVPEGWNMGRTKCVFNDHAKQKEFSDRAPRNPHTEESKLKMRESALKTSKERSERFKGDKNPTKNPEVRQKISQFALSESAKRSERMKRVKPWLKRTYGNNSCKQD